MVFFLAPVVKLAGFMKIVEEGPSAAAEFALLNSMPGGEAIEAAEFIVSNTDCFATSDEPGDSESSTVDE